MLLQLFKSTTLDNFPKMLFKQKKKISFAILLSFPIMLFLLTIDDCFIRAVLILNDCFIREFQSKELSTM